LLTLHTAALVVPGAGLPPVAEGAVAVEGSALVAVGPHAELAAAYPQARLRRWPGVLTPGLVHRDAVALLERAYHPDPREADSLGTDPLTRPDLDTLALDDTRWGGSARRGVQRLLRHGVTAVVGPFERAAVRTAVARAGVVVTVGGDVRPEEPLPPLDPLAGRPPERAFAGALVRGGRADLAAFDVSGLAGLADAGAASCVATVLGGRLAYRRR
jgi:cytosine/adenosine deaminase-related metal-dependent hydrolase